MSRFLDQLEKISLNAPAPMGFGVSRAQKTPGMALIALVSADHLAGCGVIADLSPDAALLTGIKGPQALKRLEKGLPAVPWGVRSNALTEAEAQAYQDRGCDLLAFSLQGTPVSALSSEEMARILCLDPGIDERQLRAIDPLPVDVILVGMSSQTAPWTLDDLAAIADISRRVDKFVLVEVSQPPAQKDLEAIRNAGVHGLVVDVGSVSSESLLDLKASLLEMPRQGSGKQGRATATLPTSVFPFGRSPEQEEQDDDDE